MTSRISPTAKPREANASSIAYLVGRYIASMPGWVGPMPVSARMGPSGCRIRKAFTGPLWPARGCHSGKDTSARWSVWAAWVRGTGGNGGAPGGIRTRDLHLERVASWASRRRGRLLTIVGQGGGEWEQREPGEGLLVPFGGGGGFGGLDYRI